MSNIPKDLELLNDVLMSTAGSIDGMTVYVLYAGDSPGGVLQGEIIKIAKQVSKDVIYKIISELTNHMAHRDAQIASLSDVEQLVHEVEYDKEGGVK